MADDVPGPLDNSPLMWSRDEERITLELLNAVEENAGVTQRSISRDLGIALGLANAYLRRCVRKGFIKVTQVPRNRYAYYLTPGGFAEKSRLTAEFLRQSFFLVKAARTQYADIFKDCAQRGLSNVVLLGAGEVAEIACLSAQGHAVTLVAVVDCGRAGGLVGGVPVVASLDGVTGIEAVVITDLGDPQGTFDAATRRLDPARVLCPLFMNVSRRRLLAGDGA